MKKVILPAILFFLPLILFSQGVEFVLVNGFFVVKNGENVEGAFPGRPVLGKFRR